ncbi:MAG TPA: glycosyltransferase family 1 protein [Methanobacteriaceae archaeon]|nr:glycosyltransferase family 1 protein [Methanobacteriaceae archaeon]
MGKKLKVEAILGLKTGEMYGKYRVYHKTTENLYETVSFNEIHYLECDWKYNFPLKNSFYNYFSYPHMVNKILRKDSDLVHIFSQEEAYLLKSIPDQYPKVLTCLDIIPILFEDHNSMPFPHKLIRNLRLSKDLKGKYKDFMSHADRIITISDHTKKDLIQHLGIPVDKIKTVYLGVDEQLNKATKEEISVVKQKYSLPANYILYLGSEQPRKNFPFLVKVFSKLVNKYGLNDMVLVKVGRPQIDIEERSKSFELIKNLKLENRVLFIDYVDENDIKAVYSAAKLFAYPSLYEGFGLPPLEAMSCGCPVITSNLSSLPEVVGDGGIMMDPSDVEGWAVKMHEILNEDNYRQELIKKGLKQSKQFNWKKTANETFKIYKEVI